MIFTDYIAAIVSLRPNADFSLLDSTNLDTLEWIDCSDPPSVEEIIAEQKRLEIVAEQYAYRQQRMYAYPSIGDQLDALYHAGVFPDDMASKIKDVKDRYPKPEGGV